jgi:hypothetical protein
MPQEPRPQGGDLFIVDNSDQDWKVRRYLHDWADLAHSFDIATGYFEIGALLALDGQWQKLDKIRILMGDEVSKRTKKALIARAIKTGSQVAFDSRVDELVALGYSREKAIAAVTRIRDKEQDTERHGVRWFLKVLHAGYFLAFHKNKLDRVIGDKNNVSTN